jgi:hypothetical protein
VIYHQPLLAFSNFCYYRALYQGGNFSEFIGEIVMSDEPAGQVSQSDGKDNECKPAGSPKLIDISSEPPRDIEDTPIASPTLEEFPPAIQKFRADTRPNTDAMPAEVKAAAIFERHLGQRHLVLFQPIEQQIDFHPLPYKPSPGDKLLLACPWQIMLEMRIQTHWMRLGLNLYGEVTLGRGESRDGHVMVNLNPYGASALGVSRTHLALRPTSKGLVAVDLGSTNGTTINGESIAPETEMLLPDRCEIALSKMKLLLYIVEKPE